MESYVKKFYGVPADIGRVVEFKNRKGVIAKDRGNYVGVNFDDDKPGRISNVHPNDLKYLGMGKIRRITPSQKRYQEYISSECCESFAWWLGIER